LGTRASYHRAKVASPTRGDANVYVSRAGGAAAAAAAAPKHRSRARRRASSRGSTCVSRSSECRVARPAPSEWPVTRIRATSRDAAASQTLAMTAARTDSYAAAKPLWT